MARLDHVRDLAREIARGSGGGGVRCAATVTRVEGGTPYVVLAGTDEEVPVAWSLAEVEAGQSVMATVADGRVTLDGNESSPAVGVERVTMVDRKADDALDEAGRAHAAADAAEADAARAKEAADDAQSSADAAQASATTANAAANDALVQLGTVEDVIGTATWIAEHGTYEPTPDAAVDDSKVYYERSGSGTQADPYIYTAVPEPMDEDIASYYELHVDAALSQYVASHLALTDAGLYVLKDASGYRLLCSNTGVSVIDPQGHVVATYGESITFDSSRSQYIGNEDAYILFTPANGSTPAKIVIGGSNVQLGSSKTLSEWEADMQQAIDDSAAAVQTANDVPIVTLSSTNGTVFKRNLGVSTVIVATIFTPGGRIDNATELRRRYGAGAYLEWGWRDVVTDASHVLVNTDPGIGNGGFTLTVDPDDIDTQAVITCSLNY